MKSINFKEQNCTLRGNKNDIDDLQVYCCEDMVFSRWKARFIERLKILFTGKVWFSILTKEKNHAPIKISTDYPFWTEKDIRRAKKKTKKTMKKIKWGNKN